MQLILPNTKEISDILDIGLKPSQVLSVVFLHQKWQISQRVSVATVQWPLMAPLHRIIALWVHPLSGGGRAEWVGGVQGSCVDGSG